MLTQQTRTIKKYANRRLYDTAESKHVTLADIRQMIVDGHDIRVVEDASGNDITRPLLLQIIVDQEESGQPLLSELMLAQLIRFYGNPMQGMMSDYLQRSVETFVSHQQSVQAQMQNMMSTVPLDTMRELMKQNAAVWETLFKSGRNAVAPEPAEPRLDATRSADADLDDGPSAGSHPVEQAPRSGQRKRTAGKKSRAN